MKKLVPVFIYLLITALIWQDVYAFVVTDRGLEFYAQKPLRIVLIITVGIAGGLITFGYSKFTTHCQRIIKLSTLALIAFGMSLYAIWMTYMFCDLSILLVPLNDKAGEIRGEILRLALLPAAFLVLAGMLWFSFWFIKRKNSDSLE